MAIKIADPVAALKDYLKRLNAEVKTAKGKRLRQVQSALKIANAQWAALNKPGGAQVPETGNTAPGAGTPPPAVDMQGFSPEDYKAMVDTFARYNITDPAAISIKMSAYKTATDQYEQDKGYYKQHWKTFYGNDLPEFGKLDNAFGIAAVVGSGTFNGFNLAALTTQATQLKSNVASYDKLSAPAGEAGFNTDIKNLNYSQFTELQGMYNAQLPTQAEYAQLQAGTLPGGVAGGKTKAEWETLYEGYRKGRKQLFTGEGTKAAYTNQDGFGVSGFDTEQQY